MRAKKLLKLGKKVSFESRFPEEIKNEIRESVLNDSSFRDWYYKQTSFEPTDHDNLLNLLELPINEQGFYKDKYGNRVSYNGIRTIKRSNTILPLSDIHLNEIQRCRDDFRYFRKHYAKIITKTGIARPEPRDYQEELEDSLLTLDDNVILYPRQSGKTVTVGTYLLWLAVFRKDPINIGIVANKPATAHEVLSKMKKIFVLLPIWLQQGIAIWNTGSVEFENGTRIMTDGPSSDSFRGYTINIIYIDEIAYLKKTLWDEFSDAVFPTQNSLIFKQIIMTSTANGMNHFEKIVKKAMRSDTPEKYITCDWKKVPHYDKEGNLLTPKQHREITIKKFNLKYFKQTEECEFLGSSDTLISGESMYEISTRLETQELIPQNILLDGEMYKTPIENNSYILSCDTSKDGEDDFSISVTDVSKFPFEQVFSANLQIDYLVMPEHLNELGKYYNDAFIIIENNEGSGQSITDTLWGVYEYENLYKDRNINGIGFKKYTGFRTTQKSRPLILNLLKIFIEEEKLIVNSQKTLNQLYTFTKTNSKYQAEDGFKDDAVMSLAITFAPFMQIKVFDDFMLFTKELHAKESKQRTGEFLSVIDVGFTNDDDLEAEKLEQQRLFRLEMQNIEADYSFDGDYK